MVWQRSQKGNSHTARVESGLWGKATRLLLQPGRDGGWSAVAFGADGLLTDPGWQSGATEDVVLTSLYEGLMQAEIPHDAYA